MSQLDTLIVDLKADIAQKQGLYYKIKRPNMLYRALKELRAIIGMAKVKEAVAAQVRYLIAETESQYMLNTVLYGPPGCGKSSVGKILAKIWYSLGYLDRAPVPTSGAAAFMAGLSDEEFYTLMAIALFYGIVYGYGLVMAIQRKIGWIYLLLLLVGLVLLGYLLYVFDVGRFFYSPPTEVEAATTATREEEQLPDVDELFTSVSREDFVAGYVGQTAIKTKKLLRANHGKVVFIDEAYSLLTDPHDSFGLEALTTITLYMSEHPKQLILVFVGYRDMLRHLFHAQPGLKRRFMWHWECPPYNAEELFAIFQHQLDVTGWSLEQPTEVCEMFERHAATFRNFGGDTERLAFYAQLEFTKAHYRDTDPPHVLSSGEVRRGMALLQENDIGDSKTAVNPDELYNLMHLLRARA